jgi:hypothetical protein
VPDLPEPGQRLDVDVDQVARPRPFVPLHRWFGIQIEVDWFFWTGPIVSL